MRPWPLQELPIRPVSKHRIRHRRSVAVVLPCKICRGGAAFSSQQTQDHCLVVAVVLPSKVVGMKQQPQNLVLVLQQLLESDGWFAGCKLQLQVLVDQVVVAPG